MLVHSQTSVEAEMTGRLARALLWPPPARARSLAGCAEKRLRQAALQNSIRESPTVRR